MIGLGDTWLAAIRVFSLLSFVLMQVAMVARCHDQCIMNLLITFRYLADVAIMCLPNREGYKRHSSSLVMTYLRTPSFPGVAAETSAASWLQIGCKLAGDGHARGMLGCASGPPAFQFWVFLRCLSSNAPSSDMRVYVTTPACTPVVSTMSQTQCQS